MARKFIKCVWKTFFLRYSIFLHHHFDLEKFSKQINWANLAFLECLQSYTGASLTMWLNLKIEKYINTWGRQWEIINSFQYGHNLVMASVQVSHQHIFESYESSFWDIWILCGRFNPWFMLHLISCQNLNSTSIQPNIT